MAFDGGSAEMEMRFDQRGTTVGIEPAAFVTGAYSATVCNPAGCVTTPAAILRVNAERPRLWGVVWRPDGARFQVTGAPLATYRIQASRGFKNWTDMATYTAPESGQFEVFDPDAASIDWRCYRALQQ